MYIFKISTVWDSCISACHCVQKKSISFHGFLTLFLYNSRQSLYRINKKVGVCIFIWWKVLLWSGSLIYVTVVFSTEILPIITVVIDRQFRAKDILVLFQVWSELLCEKKKIRSNYVLLLFHFLNVGLRSITLSFVIVSYNINSAESWYLNVYLDHLDSYWKLSNEQYKNVNALGLRKKY